jgi:hypothetical protein
MLDLTTFHIFSQLPSEICHNIWLLAMPSRLLEMYLVGESESITSFRDNSLIIQGFLALGTPKHLGWHPSIVNQGAMGSTHRHFPLLNSLNQEYF